MANESTSSSPAGSPSWGLVLVRIAVGAILLNAGWMKISGGISDQLVTGTSNAFATAPGIVRAWGENVVLPHPTLFAHLIAWGEFLGGLALFLGALTRIAGIAVFFQFVNFYFAGPESQRFFVLLLAVSGLGCAISHAGRKCGLDVFLAAKLPRWMT
jgi:putative oxidoreductase